RERLSAYDEPGRQEEARPGEPVHELKHSGRLERRKCQQEQEGGDELSPDEERETHERKPLGSELDNGDDEIDRSEERGGDQKDHAEEPHGLTRGGDVGAGGIGGP